MKIIKKIALFSSCLLIFGNSVVPITTVFATENSSNISSESDTPYLNIESPFKTLVEDGYLLLDEENQTIKLSEKYKQEVLNTTDTNLYNVEFTDNSVRISPKYSFRAFRGVNKIVYTWKGVDIYLDNTRSNKLAAALNMGAGAATSAAGVAALANLVPASAVAGIIAGIFAIGSGLVSYNNAAGRGIIIGCIGTLTNATPHWITSQ